MSKEQQAWKSNIKDKSDFFWSKLIEKSGLLLKKILKSNISFLKREINNLLSKTENWLWLQKLRLWKINWLFN